MRSYYAYWENQLYGAVVTMVLRNLDVYIALLDQRHPVYSVRVILQSKEVTLVPDSASIIQGSLLVVKAIIEGTKKFIRFYR